MPQDCPLHPELVAFNVGSASDEAIERISAHLETCRECCETLAMLSKNGPPGSKPVVADDLKRFRAEAAYVQAAAKIRALEWSPTAESSDSSSERPPARIGEYRVIREVGRGSTGVVYEAAHDSLGRFVALKALTSLGELPPAVIQRIRREAQAASQLHHTNIAPVFEVKREGDIWYCATQFIDGQPLDAWCRALAEKSGPPTGPAMDSDEYFRRVARIALQVAQGLDHAHQRGVLHRDIKPGNVMLDRSGTAWITDFGLAKLHDSRSTSNGDTVGNSRSRYSRHLAPERLTSGGDARSDLYGLGTILYELLTTRPLFDAQDPAELARRIAEEQPVPPRQITPRIPPDLEAIVRKCLAKDPHQRYQTARLLVEDLERFLSDRPIRGRVIPPREHVWRWARRNRGLAAAFLAITGVVLATVLVSLEVARRARATASREAEKRSSSERLGISEARRRQQAELGRRQSEQDLADLLTASGFQADERGDPAEALLWFASAAQYSAADPIRSDHNVRRVQWWIRQVAVPIQGLGRVPLPLSPFEARFHPSGPFLMVTAVKTSTSPARGSHRIYRYDSPNAQPIQPELVAAATAVDWSPDGQHLAVAQPGKGLSVLEFLTGKPRSTWPIDQPVSHISFSPNSRRVAAVVGQTVQVWDLQEQKPLPFEVVHPGPVDLIVWHESSDHLATACRDGNARVIECVLEKTKNPLRGTYPHSRWRETTPGARPFPPLFLPNNQILTINEQELQWRDWRTGDKTRTAAITLPTLTSAAASPNGRWLALVGGDPSTGLVQVHDLGTASAASPLVRQSSPVASVAFSPDGETLISAGADRTVRLWKVPSLEPAAPPSRLTSAANHATFSADGTMFATVQENREVRVWRRPIAASRRFPARNSLVAMSANGKHVLAAGTSYTLGDTRETQVFNVADGKPDGPTLSPGGRILAGCFFHQDRHVALFSGKKPAAPAVHFLNWADGKSVFPSVELPAEPRWCDVHDSSSHLAVVLADGQVVLFDLQTGKVERQWTAHPPAPSDSLLLFGNGAIRYSPDGSSLAVFGTAEDAGVFDTASGRRKFQLRSARRLHSVRFSDKGGLLATAAFDGTVQVWDSKTGAPVGEPLFHPDWAYDAVFSPDGEHLLTTCRDFAARVWRWRERTLVGRPMRHRHEVHAAAFVPGGPWVLTAGMDSSAIVWDWTRGLPMGPTIPLAGPGLNIHVSPDGQFAAIGGLASAYDVLPLDALQASPTVSLADLPTCAELISGQRREVGMGLTALTSEEWFARWQSHREALAKLCEPRSISFKIGKARRP